MILIIEEKFYYQNLNTIIDHSPRQKVNAWAKKAQAFFLFKINLFTNKNSLNKIKSI